VFPLVVAHAGRIVLHAACVSLKGRAPRRSARSWKTCP
jgi:hypothetical protein